MDRITPCLWFDTEAEEAAQFYTSVFPNSRIVRVTHYGSAGPRPEGMVMDGRVRARRPQRSSRSTAGPSSRFTEAISFQVDCKDQDEVDRYWETLSAGGEAGPCGWLKDRYGVSWQVVPSVLYELIADPDAERAQRAIAAMLQMRKIVIDELERAADGVPAR